MIIAWVVYGLFVGGLVVVATHAVDRVCRIIGQPTRWVWLGALLLLVVLIGMAPYRQNLVTYFVSGRVVGNTFPNAVRWNDVHTWRSPVEGVEALLRSVTVQADHLIVLASRFVPNTWGHLFALVWSGLSLCLFLILVMVSWRVYRARNGWPITELHGMRVLVTSAVGPVVVGVLRPAIVIPRWLLGCSVEEQRLVLAHEREHVRAYDSLILAIACLGIALVPWHPALWWIFSRLRLAVELDCDRRVLRQGVAPRAYGGVLIELAGRCSRLPLGAPALADRASHLEQRILAMQPSRLPYPKLYGIALSSIAGTALIVACATEGPSTAPKPAVRASRLAAAQAKDPIVLVNGERTTGRALGQIDPNNIKTIEVFKGRSASALYGPDAANGVILITTK